MSDMFLRFREMFIYGFKSLDIFNAGDKERELNLPITFAFDRYNPVPQHKFQMVKMKTNTIYCVFFRTNNLYTYYY